MNEERIADALYTFVLKERFNAGREIFDTFNKLNIPYAVHKGAVLSQVLYGNPAARRSGDIDLLLSRDYSMDIRKIFEQAGFIQGRINGDSIVPYTRAEKIYQASQSHQLSPYVKATKSKLCPFVEYDCNLDIFWGESQRHTDMSSFLQNSIETELFGVQIRKLTSEAELIALCMHHYKDMNSIYLLYVRGFDVKQLWEIAQYVNTASIDIPHLIKLCRQYEVGDYICYCVHFVNMLYPSEKLRIIEATLSNQRSEMLYDCFGLCESERKHWSIGFEERISDVRKYMEPLLTDADKRKIELNIKMM